MTSHRKISVVFGLVCFASIPAQAAELVSHVAVGVNAGLVDFNADGTEPFARFGYEFSHATTLSSADIHFALIGEIWAGQAELNETHNLQEAYVEVTGQHGLIGVGRRVFLQGVADGFSPTDVVAPRNFRLSSYENEGNRFGLDGAWGTAYLGDSFVFSGYVYDGRQSHLLPNGIFDQPLALPDRPVESDEPVYGGRLSYAGNRGDFGLSYYQGSAAFPILVLDGSDIQPVVPELRMIGLDADTVFGAWRVHGETALHTYAAGEFDVADGFLPDDEIQTSVGVEFEVNGGSRLGMQIFHRSLRGERNAETGPAAALAESVRSIYGQYADTQTGASLSYNWESDDTRWGADAAISSWFEDDYFLGFRARYRLTESSVFYLNADYFGGPDETLYGAFEDSSNISFEFRHSF